MRMKVPQVEIIRTASPFTDLAHIIPDPAAPFSHLHDRGFNVTCKYSPIVEVWAASRHRGNLSCLPGAVCCDSATQALDVIRKYSPIIEIGAGLGYWERELSARGAKVLAVDNRSALPLPDVRIKKPTFVGKVVHSDESLVSKNPKHTLLLVYPGPDDMAYKALQRYRGDTLLYVGEARGGVNANPAFFDALEKDWICAEVHPVEPFPNGLEKLWVLKPKGANSKRGWIW